MADHYVDFSGGSDASDGSSWANAWATMTKALITETPGDGDNYYVKTDSSGTNTDVTSGSKAYKGGTASNPIAIFGCKNGTTAEPPTDSDLITTISDTDIPVFGTSDNSISLTSDDGFLFHRVRVECPSGNFSGGAEWVKLKECYLFCNILRVDGFYVLEGTNLELTTSSGYIQINSGELHWYNGDLVQATGRTNGLFRLANGIAELWGVDISQYGSGKNILDSWFRGTIIQIHNCQHDPASSLTNETKDEKFTLKIHASNNDTGKSSGSSVLEFREAYPEGQIEIETTAVRTGGANDGASGAFSLAATTNANLTSENRRGLLVRLFPIWVEGDGTSKTLTVFFAKSASVDWDDDEIGLKVLSMDDGGTSQFDLTEDVAAQLATPASHTDDMASSWGTGANNPQSMSVSIAPDYEGYVQPIVEIFKREASPTTVYLDPNPVLT